uniref:Chemokine-like factor n=1 Tax=Mus spicilegus TaxID=10103 RepID=A0A8C6HW71_MUSSI
MWLTSLRFVERLFSCFFYVVVSLLMLEFSLCYPLKGSICDVINSMVTALCMFIVSVLALIPETSTKTILGGVFGFLTVTCTIADCALMCQKLRFRPRQPYQKKSTNDINDRE